LSNTSLHDSRSSAEATLGVSLELKDLVDSSTNPTPLVLATTDTEAPVVEEDMGWQEFTVKSGDSLSLIFQRAGLKDRDLYELFSSTPESKELRRIMPGEIIVFRLNDENKLDELTYIQNELTSLQFTRTDKGFESKKLEREPEIQIAFRHASITSSLFMAGKNAGMASN